MRKDLGFVSGSVKHSFAYIVFEGALLVPFWAQIVMVLVFKYLGISSFTHYGLIQALVLLSCLR